MRYKKSMQAIDVVKLSDGYLIRSDDINGDAHMIQKGHKRERDVCLDILHDIQKLLEE